MPEAETLLNAANNALRQLYELLVEAPEPHAEANADAVHVAWAALSVVNLDGLPFNEPCDPNETILYPAELPSADPACQQVAHVPSPDWLLILCDDPDQLPALETAAGMSQAEAVDSYLEESCWSQDVPQFVGRRGSPEQRRAALAAAYRLEWPELS